MSILCFSDVLIKVGLDPKKVKLIRHAYSDKGFKACAEKGMIYEYTCHQKSKFSSNYDYWAVFISDKGTLAKLYALYKVNGVKCPDTKKNMPKGMPEIEAKQFKGENAIFDLEPVDYLKEYEGKLIIDWGNAAISWHQKGTIEKPIISILPDEKKVFSGYENLVKTYDQLKEIIENEQVYESWHTALKSVYAIYLIIDTETGEQYVGSAYGEEGLLGRWKAYVSSQHGNNKKMKELICNYPERYHAFQFSILQILPKTLTDEQIVGIENLWKMKLQSKKFGMNDN